MGELSWPAATLLSFSSSSFQQFTESTKLLKEPAEMRDSIKAVTYRTKRVGFRECLIALL